MPKKAYFTLPDGQRLRNIIHSFLSYYKKSHNLTKEYIIRFECKNKFVDRLVRKLRNNYNIDVYVSEDQKMKKCLQEKMINMCGDCEFYDWKTGECNATEKQIIEINKKYKEKKIKKRI